MFYTKKCNKSPLYYIAHPHEAYIDGYDFCLGTATDQSIEFQAYSYYLPTETVKLIPKINDYFHVLISSQTLSYEKQRRKSCLESIDIALNALFRTDFMVNMGNVITIGSKHIKQVAWAVIGEGNASCKFYTFKFNNIYAIIDHYTHNYVKPGHCHPICLYHQPKGRETLNSIAVKSPFSSGKLSPNVVIAGAIHFLADLLEHCGPDVDTYFDLFTNDLTCSPDDVDISLWLKCRERALLGGTSFQVPAKVAARMPYVQGPKPMPQKIRIVVTEEEVNDLTTGTKTTNFQSIIINHNRTEKTYVDCY